MPLGPLIAKAAFAFASFSIWAIFSYPTYKAYTSAS
jgi:hypothetical protein